MNLKKLSVGIFLMAGLTGCATSTHLKKVKLVSFVDDTTGGKSVGTLRGEDCAWRVLGYDIGTANITRAIDKARTGATDLSDGGDKVRLPQKCNQSDDLR